MMRLLMTVVVALALTSTSRVIVETAAPAHRSYRFLRGQGRPVVKISQSGGGGDARASGPSAERDTNSLLTLDQAAASTTATMSC